MYFQRLILLPDTVSTYMSNGTKCCIMGTILDPIVVANKPIRYHDIVLKRLLN